MKSASIYGLQVFVAAFVLGLVVDYIFRESINWGASAGFAAFLGASLAFVHSMGWMPAKNR